MLRLHLVVKATSFVDVRKGSGVVGAAYRTSLQWSQSVATAFSSREFFARDARSGPAGRSRLDAWGRRAGLGHPQHRNEAVRRQGKGNWPLAIIRPIPDGIGSRPDQS
jgi:hypothetical protein